MNFKLVHSLIFFAFIAFSVTSVSAQENAGVQDIQLLKNSSIDVLIYSNPSTGLAPGTDPNTVNEITGVNTGNAGNAIWTFTPPIGFTGTRTFVIEYRGAGTPGSWPPKYTTLNFEVVESIITAGKDVVTYPSGATNKEIFPLINDGTTASNVNLIDIAQASGGTAVITANNSIMFTPDVNTDFVAHVEYIIEDDLGSSTLGSITIQSDDVAGVDSMSFNITNDKEFHILLPTPNCTVASGGEALFGTVAISGADLMYMPDAASLGTDAVTLVDGSTNLHIELNVVNPPNQVGSVRDDYYFTTVNTNNSTVTLDFDVFENDLKNTGVFVVDYSPELTHNGFGDFSFTPIAWTKGVYEFHYTIYNGFEHQTAKIFISVDDFKPLNITAESLSGLKNTPIVLEHQIPLDAHDFEVLSAPSNGTVNVGTGLETIQIDCNQITGNKMVIYTPNNNFIGEDYFDLNYKINGQNGPVIKVNIEIFEDNQASLCHCIGPDCVWIGDTNNDGEVYVDDLLPIGLKMGSTGAARNDISYNQWQGQHGTDWGETMGADAMDIKFIDSDGNGRITAEDATAISNNFTKVHNFVSDPFVGNKEYGLFLIPHQSVVDSGDMACLDVHLTNGAEPLIDLYGVSFGINIAHEIIDSASWTMDFLDDSWLTYNASHLHMEVIPFDGRMDVAITRSDAKASTGTGIIGTTCFIVEDDVGGFRDEAKNSSDAIPITTTRGKSMDSNGNTFHIANAEVLIPLVKLDKDEEPRDQNRNDIIVFPNPTTDVLNIHFNGPRDIEDIVIHDLYKSVIHKQEDVRSDRWSFDTSSLAQGIYIISIRTNDGWTTQRFEVFRSR